MAEVRTLKNEIREKFKPIRDEYTDEKRREYDEKIANRVISSITFRHSQDILFYASKEKEIDTWKIFEKALDAGKNVYFPKCYDGGIMKYYLVKSKDELKSGEFGILEPTKLENEYSFSNITSLCIVPALIFDKEGYRIGYGKGYYDRFLSKFKGVSVGLAYKELIQDRLPRGHFDRHVDIIVSDKGVYAINADK